MREKAPSDPTTLESNPGPGLFEAEREISLGHPKLTHLRHRASLLHTVVIELADDSNGLRPALKLKEPETSTISCL